MRDPSSRPPMSRRMAPTDDTPPPLRQHDAQMQRLRSISDNQVRLADVLTDIVNRLRQPPTANGH